MSASAQHQIHDGPRLDPPPAPAAEAQQRPGGYRRTCLECGTAFRAVQPHGDFCAVACRRAWNNRRMTRGAELYDLFMALRCDRETAKALKVWKLLNRLAAGFREEDRRSRNGRPSWRPARSVVARRPDLQAEVLLGPAKSTKR